MITRYLDSFTALLEKVFRILRAKKIPFLLLVNIIMLIAVFRLGPYFLLVNFIFSVSFLFPEVGLYFLFGFIPIKALLKSNLFLPSAILTLLVPVALLGSYLGYKSRKGQSQISRTDLFLFFIFLAGLVSTLGSIFQYGVRAAQLLDFFVWLQLVGFYLLGKSVAQGFERPILVNGLIANAVSVWGIISFFGTKVDRTWLESYELISERATSTFGNPNALAGYLLLSVLLVAALFLKTKNNKYLVLLPLPLVVFFLTFSRGALVVLALVSVAYLLLKRNWKLLAALTVFSLIAFLIAPTSFQARIKNVLNPEHLSFSSDSGRIWAARNVIYINRTKFLFGNGWGSYGGEYAYRSASPVYLEGVQEGVVGVANTDDQWLQVYAQEGIVGLWLYLLLFFPILKPDYLRKEPLGYVLLALLLLGFFIDVFQFYQIAFLGFLTLGIVSAQGLPLTRGDD